MRIKTDNILIPNTTHGEQLKYRDGRVQSTYWLQHAEQGKSQEGRSHKAWISYSKAYSIEGLAEIICQSKSHCCSPSLLKNLLFYSDAGSVCIEQVHDD